MCADTPRGTGLCALACVTPPANSAHGAPFRTGGCFRVSVCMHTRTAAGPTRCTATSRVPGLVLNLVWLGLTQFFSQFCNRSDPRGK